MCGIFGIISQDASLPRELAALAKHAQQRGRDSSGLVRFEKEAYQIHKADCSITDLLKKVRPRGSRVLLGHSRLITNGLTDNQPVVRDGICVLHNGIIVNDDEIWPSLVGERQLHVDTEVIAAIVAEHLDSGGEVHKLADAVLQTCRGTVACAVAIPHLGKLCLFSNNGSLFYGEKDGRTLFASEAYALQKVGCQDVSQIYDCVVLEIPQSETFKIHEHKSRRKDLIPRLDLSSSAEALLVSPNPNLLRCTRCILPETMPFIRFDDAGVCNYCRNYKIRNKPRPPSELFDLVQPYRRTTGSDCIVPFSGGRDSCYALHLIVNELKMKPITYTHDWGMVTDLGRRNISRMSAALGVENIIIAADISKKRDNIARNLRAWLKSPHLGLISVLTAGDKHFFRHVEEVKRQTGISLNLWGVNPLEVTHFKSGFLGVRPDFDEERVYISNAAKQLDYQGKRLRAMLDSPGYFNRSLWDTVTGEYYRSFTKKEDYFHVFDFWTWDEKAVDDCLLEYEWERAPDTNSTWRIGDGTAAFYNYVYFLVAGFTEHDTFRSNQIREGQITRKEALALVEEENRPRYPNIKWYLDTLGLDFSEVINTVNAIPRLYSERPSES